MKTIKAVIGLGFGDEGKGITTDYLCSQTPSPMVVRYSGGQQAGHTVLSREFDVRHVFSNFGSGSLKGVPTYWSKFCTVDPIGIVNELEVLQSKGISPTLYIDERCPVTTPYDTFHNQTNAKESNHGSCGVGVGSTFQREQDFYSLTFGDIFNDWILKTKLENIEHYYNSRRDKSVLISLPRFLQCIKHIRMYDKIKPVFKCPQRDNLIFESSQGLLLDQHFGFFPHVTRSSVGSKNIFEMMLENSCAPRCYPTANNIEYYLITRAYQTRHGNGPMSNYNLSHNIKVDPDETNKTNEYQGEFKRSLLDVSLLEYGINKDEGIRTAKNKTLVVTCLDHIVNEYRFTYDGKMVFCDNKNDFAEKVSNILKIDKLIISESPNSENFLKIK